MKKVLLTIVITIAAAASAQAESYTYECHQIRTTAEEAKATTPLKSMALTSNGRSMNLSRSSMRIESADQRLVTGGAPMKHISYGGYLKLTSGEVFLCEREI